MNQEIKIPLDLPNIRVISTKTNGQGDYVITVESTLDYTNCGRCGRKIEKFHGHDRLIQLRHLPILGREVYIRLRPKRYECPHCSRGGKRKTTTQQLSWYQAKSRHTKVYEERILLHLVNSTIEDVSVKEKIGYEAVVGIIDRYIETKVDWLAYAYLDVIGIDEIALQKGHSHYIVIITARLRDGSIKLLTILPNREKKTVKAFLATIPTRLKRTIHTVCTDMWSAYVNAAQEELPQAAVVVDRFHVAKKYRDCTDQLRKQQLRRLKAELEPEEYDTIKGAMWPLRKNKAALTTDEAALLERLFAYAPDLKLAYDFRNDLTAIFDKPQTKTQATEAITTWRKQVEDSDLSCFDPFLTTLDTYLDQITNYFLLRHSSGFVEGLNNKIKVLKRRCFGIRKLDHLFQRLFLDLEGYSLFV